MAEVACCSTEARVEEINYTPNASGSYRGCIEPRALRRLLV